ncbi:MAG: DUF1365 domain-containing protein [Bdellovibrionaceae bacterium]|nr:DUF1365 domain-containing protein [Pseudobdellovibrionaceae bacterium]
MIQLLEGHVFHARTETAENSFSYPICNIYFSTDKVSELKRMLKSKYFGLLQFNPMNYLEGSETDLHARLRSFVLERFNFQENRNYDKVYLQTIPKMFGYAFNPVNFWYFYAKTELVAVLCEVNNTFGERHYYWLNENQSTNLLGKWLQSEKRFHVSPFFDVKGLYQFKFIQNEGRVEAHIKYQSDEGKNLLLTWIKGNMKPLGEASLARILVRYGWMTPLVVFRIHYQAVKLWLKRVKFFSLPKAPQSSVTYGRLKNDEKDN